MPVPLLLAGDKLALRKHYEKCAVCPETGAEDYSQNVEGLS